MCWLKNIVTLIFPVFSTATFASSPRTELNLRWMKDNYLTIQEHLKNDDSKLIVPIINTLGEIWVHRDGAVSGEVSPLLLVALNHHTHITLVVLSSEPDSYSKWLNELEGIVFTDFNGEEVERLSHAKEALVKALVSYTNSNPKTILIPYGERLLERLEEITIRSVD